MSFSIAGRLKELRLKSGKSKAAFARLLGLPYTTYNNYETGNREPNLETINKISQILGVEMPYLLSAPFSTPIQRVFEDRKIEEDLLLDDFRKLNAEGKSEAKKQIKNLTKIADYTENVYLSNEE